MKVNYKQLILARQYKGITQTDLSNSIKGLSQSTLSKFEKGIGVIPDEVFADIADYLGFPLAFFEKKLSVRIENTHYRKRSNVGAKNINALETTISFIGDAIDIMSNEIEYPPFSLEYINVEDGYSPENIANFIRRKIGLKCDDPVKDIISRLEVQGIIIYEIETELDSFDGVSFISNMGIPIIIINKKMPNDRKRFTIAHELGHIVMHLSQDFIISDFRDKEKEANLFASEFLMPTDAIKNSLSDLKISYLGDIKRHWLTSMASIIHKARQIGYINADKYKYLNIELSRCGYKKKEPIDVYIDTPQIIKESYNLYKNELSYSDEDLAETFALPITFIKKFFNQNENKLRLKIVK